MIERERCETDGHGDASTAQGETRPDGSDATTHPDAPALVALDRVLDRDADPDKQNVGVVIEHARARAADHCIDALDGSPTVADLNPEHPPDAPVIVVAFEAALDRDASGWREVPRGDLADRLAVTAVSTYAYPVTRLEKVELATDGGRALDPSGEEAARARSRTVVPPNNAFYNPAGRAKRKARNTPLRKEAGWTPLPSSTVGISASPSSSAAAVRRPAWFPGPERPDHARIDPGGTMKTTRHHDREESTDHDHGDRERARAVLDRHPDASGPELLGALALDPRDEKNRRLVADLTGEPLGSGDEPTGDDVDGTEQRTLVTDGGRTPVESRGDPLPDSLPVDLPCQGPECEARVRTYLTDEDMAARPTVRVHRYTPETDDERLVRYWFCSPDCRTAFIHHDEREETLYDDEGDGARGQLVTDGGTTDDRPLALRSPENTVRALVRGQRFAEVLFDADRPGPDDPPVLVGLDRVHPEYFARIERERPAVADDPVYTEFRRDHDVICVADPGDLPDEFSVAWTAVVGEGGAT